MSHPKVPKEYSFPEIYELPYNLQEKCHACGKYSAVNTIFYKGGPPICGNCNRVVPWFFFKCVKCEVYFIQDFRHPKFCGFYPTCWTHTLELEWEYCTKHKADPEKFEFYRKVIEPVGLNPRIYTPEELAEEWDFEGSL